MKLASRRAIVRITDYFLLVFRMRCIATRMQTERRLRRSGFESRALIYAMIALSEIGEYLVADGAHGSGEIIDAHAIADQRGKIAATHGTLGQLRDVDGEQVHRHAAGDGTTPAGHDHVGCGLALGGAGRPQEAARVAYCHHRNAARPGSGKSSAVADGFALADRAHLDDPALELDHRAQGVLPPRGRVDTVERHARTN